MLSEEMDQLNDCILPSIGSHPNAESFEVYCEAVESYEDFQNLLKENPSLDLSIIKQQLNICCSKLDNIISLEDTNSDHLITLVHLKTDLTRTLDLLQTSHQTTSKKTSNFPSSPSKKARMTNDSNEKLLSVVKNTIMTPKMLGLAEIAGLDNVKKTLKSLVLLPKQQPQLFVNKKPSNSVLLFGPPGTGKTRLVHALAAEAKAKLHCVSAGDVLSPFIGENEKMLQVLFEYIRKQDEFTILFVDEIDGICCRRNTGEQEYSRRLKTELMVQLSKIEDAPNLFMVCATNCPWDLDSAILRRFQNRLYIPLPSRIERQALLELFLKNTPLTPPFSNELLDKTNGYSGSNISDLVQCALGMPLVELQDAELWKVDENGHFEPVYEDDGCQYCDVMRGSLEDIPSGSAKAREVNHGDLLKAADMSQVTLTKAELRMFEQFQNK